MREYVDWCLEKARLAMLDYNQPDALVYIELAGIWNNKEID